MKNAIIQDPRLDLYIDESGLSYVGQSKFRYFLITAVIIDPKQRTLANLLMQKWRDKYLLNPYKCLHAFDFFESKNPKASHIIKTELSISRNFNNAVEELMEFLSYITFKSISFYVDLPKVRSRLHIDEPPAYSSAGDYKLKKKEFSRKLKKSLSGKIFIPLDLTIKRALNYHLSVLKEEDAIGYVNAESNRTTDLRLVGIYNTYIDIDSDYGKKVLGIRLHNKKSLDAGIEIADLISYISFQTLRFSKKLNAELADVPKNRFKVIQKVRTELRNLGVDLEEVTMDPL